MNKGTVGKQKKTGTRLDLQQESLMERKMGGIHSDLGRNKICEIILRTVKK
jgi:hypothetical protein